jgi:hypothetical protein
VTDFKSVFEAHRAAVEMTYTDICSISGYVSVKDEETGITSKVEKNISDGIPCRLSYEKTDTANQQTGAAERTLVTKLFLAPETEVKAGSKITITSNGVTRAYCMSGEPAIYADHQEVMLQMFERWA